MKSKSNHIIENLKDKGLKVTPQRIAVLVAIQHLKSHPTTEKIIEYIKKGYPNIAVGTVYKVLDTLVENNLVKRVKTEKDIMRYDGVTEHHHHIYCTESERIEDYYDEELDSLLSRYFSKKGIRGFEIEEIKIHIKGKYRQT
ncbi:MAG: transcriptional repressor [Bacteroidales bacterium]|nr:transcriptional repressor [Bacteroidales bacterium]MBN2698923.1 transcriptional repressor [Bacteroidales bacterium]